MLHRYVFCCALVLVLSAGALGASQRPAPKKGKPPVAKQQAPQAVPALAPVQAAPAPAPPTPEQGPSSPPEVTFQGGQLTITARNSTMSDVLNAVKQKTGAAVDMPRVSSERVVGQFGPGAPRDVVAQLLNGSHYDYVLMGSPNDPRALNKIVLMARASGPEPVQTHGMPAQQMGGPPMQAVPQIETDQNSEENAPEMPAEVQQPEVQPPDQQEEGQPEQPQPGQNGASPVKTPEQLLRELQQQQQQQQQQQNPPQ